VILFNTTRQKWSTHPLQGNPEQYQKSKIKSQNDKLKCKKLPHFCPLTFEFCFSVGSYQPSVIG